MWDEVDNETGATREAELKSIFWNAMIDLHSNTGRFVGTRDSAFRLIAPILSGADGQTTPFPAGQKPHSKIKLDSPTPPVVKKDE